MQIAYFCSGFNPENAFFDSLATQLKKDLKKTDRIVFIPGSNRYEKILKALNVRVPEFIQHFKRIGIEFDHVDVITPTMEKELAQDLLNNSDMVVLMGGNPFLQKELFDSKDLGPILKDYQGVILGYSAGAMNMSKYIIITPCSLEYPDFDIRPGLNLANISIYPHNNFAGDVVPKRIIVGDEISSSDDLLKVARHFGNFYLLQDYLREDGNYDVSVIRVEGNNATIFRENNGKVWKTKYDEFNIVDQVDVKKDDKAKLILVGGGYGEQTVLANAKLNDIIDHTKPILYIPLAIDLYKHPLSDCYEFIKVELSLVDVPSIDMVNSFEELEKKDLNNYSAIFIGGGNTYKLLKGLKETKSFKNIRNYLNKGGVVIGSSAGAVIFGEDINVIDYMDPNEVELEDTKGFNFLNGISIAPHYTNRKSSLTDEENNKIHETATTKLTEYSTSKGKVIAIPEEDFIYVYGDYVEVLGQKPYYIFEDGIRTKCNIEEKVKKL